MKKMIATIAIASILIFSLTGCFGREENQTTPIPDPKPVGYWQNTTEYRWITNGTCCGEKEKILREYILEDKVNHTEWKDTGRTRDNISKLPEDGWYVTGLGNIYAREEEFRKHICYKGKCLYSVTETRWYQTGAMILEGIDRSREVSISRGTEVEWYFVIEPVENKTVDISFKVLAEGYDDLPVLVTRDLKSTYSSGKITLPEKYSIDIIMNSGVVNIYILDEIGYNELF